MWSQLVYISVFFTVALAEITAPGIDRTVNDGVRSMGFSVVYGDEDMTMVNEVISDMEKKMLKKKINLKQELPELPPEDVKCLMSVDKYCSKEMGEMKSVLIQALKEDCSKCTKEQREKAGRIVASMMAHDPVAWKIFLTRYDTVQRIQKILG